MNLLKYLFTPELRCNPEYQSAWVRLGLWLFSIVYIGLGATTGYYRVDVVYYVGFFGVFLTLFVGLGVSVFLRPDWPARRFAALAVDVSGASLAIFLTQEAISPFYLLYIWVFISYGTRYGQIHLTLASILSMLAYSGVLIALDEWQQHTFEAIFFLLLLAVLPFYQYSLLRKLHEARQEAERANQAKSDFLATMTHELRTPLSGVVGMTRLLESTRLTPEQQDYVQSISTSVRLLGSLIGDILDLSKIEARKLHLERMGFDLREAVLEVCNACETQALDKGLELVSRVDASIPDTVMGDPLRLRQVLFNLVGNAVKFTERGEVVVSATIVSAEEAEGRDPQCLIEVRDSGIGIPKEKLANIFDDFWQADDSTTRRFGGTGLGTTIARDLVELMGGHIEVESSEGVGSVFRIQLPLLAGTEELEVEPDTVRSDSELAGRLAIVYEPNAASRELLADVCQSLGLDWQPLENIGQLGAMLSSQERSVDLAILADSPAGEDLNGIHMLLGRVLNRELPVLFLTYGSRRLDPSGTGAPHLNKPFLGRDLRCVLLRLMQGRAVDAGSESSPGLPGEREPGSGLDVLVAEDNAIAAKVITTFLGKQGHRVSLTRNGEDTLVQSRGRPFDIAFVDLRMPRIDGLEFTRRFRKDEPAHRHMPIIALTANAAEDIKQEALDAGMDDFLTKPVAPEALEYIIGRYAPIAQQD